MMIKRLEISKIVDGIRAVFPKARVRIDEEVMREGYGPPTSILYIDNPGNLHHNQYRQVMYHHERAEDLIPGIIARMAHSLAEEAIRKSA